MRDARGLVLIHPFDDPHVLAGQGTLGLELLDDVPDVGTVVVPIGGGGLISGVAIALRHLRPDVRIVGVEPEGAPTLTRALDAGGPVSLEQISTIADGLSAPFAGALTYEITRDLVDDVVLVSDAEIRDAMRALALRAKVVAEPAAAAGLAALLAGRVGARPGPGGGRGLRRQRGRRRRGLRAHDRRSQTKTWSPGRPSSGTPSNPR